MWEIAAYLHADKTKSVKNKKDRKIAGTQVLTLALEKSTEISFLIMQERQIARV